MPKCIGVIEDNQRQAFYIKEILEAGGKFSVAAVLVSSPDWLDDLRKADPDFILIDHKMHGVSRGPAVDQQLRADLRLRQVPRAFLTRYDDEDALQKYAAEQNVEVLAFAMEQHGLAARVQRAIDEASQRAASKVATDECGLGHDQDVPG